MANDETVWIIGASDGIGEALAREWAARGARVILSARSEEKLKSLAVGLGLERRVVLVIVSIVVELIIIHKHTFIIRIDVLVIEVLSRLSTSLVLQHGLHVHHHKHLRPN